jgi:hypothetical protein
MYDETKIKHSVSRYIVGQLEIRFGMSGADIVIKLFIRDR